MNVRFKKVKFDKSKLKYILPLLLIPIFFVYKLSAQNPPPGLMVHPTNFDLSLTPGKTQSGTIYLRNNTKNTLEIKVDKRNFTAEGEEGQVALTEEENTFSLASWVTVSPQSQTVAPNQEVKFNFELTPPLNAEAGGHFGSLVFRTIANPNLNQTGAALSQEVASLLLVRIPGNVVEQASIASFKTNKGFYEFGPVEFETRVKNEGGVHLKPAGVITVTNNFGQTKYVGIEGQNVLPGAIRKLPATLDDNWLIGKYTASLALSYGSKNDQLYTTTQFYAFPVRAALISMVVLAVLFVLRKRLWKSLRILIRGK